MSFNSWQDVHSDIICNLKTYKLQFIRFLLVTWFIFFIWLTSKPARHHTEELILFPNQKDKHPPPHLYSLHLYFILCFCFSHRHLEQKQTSLKITIDNCTQNYSWQAVHSQPYTGLLHLMPHVVSDLSQSVIVNVQHCITALYGTCKICIRFSEAGTHVILG